MTIVDGPAETPIRSLTRHSGARMSLTTQHKVDHTDAELAELNDEFERLPASKVIEWAVATFGHHLSMSASMTDAVLIDLATRVDPAIEVIFIDWATLAFGIRRHRRARASVRNGMAEKIVAGSGYLRSRH